MTLDPRDGLRRRQDAALSEDRRRRATAAAAAFPATVGRVYGNPTVPNTGGVFVSVHPVDVGGVESESGPGLLSPDATRSFLAYVVGSTPPVAGDDLVCRFVGHRWVAERMSQQSSGLTITGCTCTGLPTTLRQTLAKNDLSGTLLPCTFTWQTLPSWLTWVQSGTYLSESFNEPVTGQGYMYQFYCLAGSYAVRKVYPPNPAFPSGHAGPGIWRWVPGFNGNTCSPFSMVSGSSLIGIAPAVGLKVKG